MYRNSTVGSLPLGLSRRFLAPCCSALIVCLMTICGFALFSGSALKAQSTSGGGIQGTVTDPVGAVVPGAKVTITGKATGHVITATTRAAGAIVIADLTRPDFGDAVRPSHGAGLDQLVRAGL